FGLGSPNRLKGLHDHRDVDIRDGHRTKRRIDVGRKGIRPLLCVLGIAPTSCVRVDVSLCALPECDRSRYIDLLRTILGFAFFSGSILSTSSKRCAAALFRASARPTFASPPKPISRAFPSSM